MKKLKLVVLLLVSFVALKPNVFATNEAYIKITSGDQEVEYTLQEATLALTATNKGDEIVILQDLDLTPICEAMGKWYIPFADDVTVDLNGKTITASPNCVSYLGNNLTVKNGKFTVTSGSYGLYIGNSTAEFPSTTYNYFLENLVIDGGLNVFNAKNVVLRNVKSTGTNYYSVWADSMADIIIESGEFTGTGPGVIASATGGKITINGGNYTSTDTTKLVYMCSDCEKPSITGGTFNVDPTDYVKEGYKSYSVDNKYSVAEIFDVLNHAGENGVLTFDKDFAIAGEVVTMTITPNECYEIESVRIIDKDNNEIEVEDNKFTMPASDVWVSVKFSPIQTTEIPVVDKDNAIGVTDADKTEDVLLDTITKDDKYKDLTVTVEVVVEEIETNKDVEEEFNKALEQDKKENSKIVSYFDISVAVKNTVTAKIEGYLDKLTDKLEFTIALPTLDEVKDGYVRNYYVIKKHGDKVEVLDVTLTKDGKHITFSTDEFSTYALAYEDVANENPKTLDNIGLYLVLGTLSLVALASVIIYRKKRYN